MAALETIILTLTTTILGCEAETKRINALSGRAEDVTTSFDGVESMDRMGALSNSLSCLVAGLRDGIFKPVLGGAKLSPTLRRRLCDMMQALDTHVKRIQGQFARVDESNRNRVSAEALTTVSTAMDAYLEATRQLAGGLKIAFPEKQDLYLNDDQVKQSEYKAMLASAPMLSNFSILGPMKQGAEDADKEDAYEQQIQTAHASSSAAKSKAVEAGVAQDEPPPYTDSQASASSPSFFRRSSTGSTQEGKGKGRALSGLSTITHGFKAMVTGFNAKPDPLVSTLCEATRRGEVAQMKGLIAQGADIDGRNQDGHTAIHVAITAFENEALKLLLDSGADWTSKGSSSKLPPLFHAAVVGNFDAAYLLFAKGARVDDKAVNGQPYFADVAIKGSYDGVKFLLENGADANTRSITGRPILGFAIDKQDKSLIRLLVRHGAKVDSNDLTGGTLLGSTLNLRNLELASELLTLGADPNVRSLAGGSVLAQAVSRRDFEAAITLLMHGADPNSKDVTGVHVLMRTLQCGLPQARTVQLVKMLLQNGADPNVRDLTGHNNCITHAIQNGDSFEVVDLLLQHGADANSKTSGNEPLLMRALARGKMDQAASLLRHGADPNVTSVYRAVTPLMIAIMKLDKHLVKMLVKHGATVEYTGEARIREFVQAARRPDVLEWVEQGTREKKRRKSGSGDAPGSARTEEREGEAIPSRPARDEDVEEAEWVPQPPDRREQTPPPEYSRYGSE